jgi:hypothetical protein
MRQIILFESFKQKHEALVLLTQSVTPLYLRYLQNKRQGEICYLLTEVCKHQYLQTFTQLSQSSGKTCSKFKGYFQTLLILHDSFHNNISLSYVLKHISVALPIYCTLT